MEVMRERWERLCVKGGVALEVAQGGFDEIVQMYASPARAYHNLEHIGACLCAADALVERGLDWRVELAIWLHDGIYEPLAPDNEARSAEVGAEFARRLGGLEEDGALVRRLILATRHVAPPADADEAVVVDADLSILGATEAVYDSYAAAIRKEYTAVPEDQFRAGRHRFVEQMLARAAIYSTPRGRELWEDSARANVKRELARLR